MVSSAFVGIPNAGTVSIDLLKNMILWLTQPSMTFEICPPTHVRPRSAGYNAVAASFLATENFPYCIFIDADAPGVADLSVLTRMDQDVIYVPNAGLLVAKRSVLERLEPPWFMFGFDDDGLYACDPFHTFITRATGAGFKATTRRVNAAEPAVSIATAKGAGERIFVAVPNMGSVRVEMSMEILRWFRSGANIHFYAPGYVQPIPAARNLIVKYFLESSATRLLMVDSDMCAPIGTDGLPEVNFLDLAESDRDVAAPLMLMWKDDQPEPLVLDKKPDGFGVREKFALDGWTQVAATGTGVIMIARRVLEKMPPPWFEYVLSKETGLLALGQDFRFCQKVSDLGFQIWVNTTMHSCHYQAIDIYSIFARQHGIKQPLVVPLAEQIGHKQNRATAPPENAQLRTVESLKGRVIRLK